MTASNGFMGRDAFVAASKRRFRDVPLGDGKCRIRSLTAGEWADLDLKSLDKKGAFSVANYKYSDARLIVSCVVDGDGNPVFRDSDLDMIMGLDTSLVNPLVREIKSHCRILGVEDSEKNLNGTGGGATPCTSSAPPAQEAATG